MHKKFDHKEIEPKWQKQWEQDHIYRTTESDKPKTFVLDMFPYPSGEGLHVGHPKGYIATDIYSRFKRMNGHEVLHPMGWDAFGLPAENFAIKHKIHPREAVETNIARFKEQLQVLGFDYDWDREINTTDPDYYKWTQWIFTQLFKKGLAYESHEPINWCPGCQTGLANEDVEPDGTCERCDSKVEKKPMRQWVLKIREYADRMLEDLDTLEWPEHIKEAQRNWIGKSEGAEILFPLQQPKQHFVILHGKGRRSDEIWYQTLKNTLESFGHTVEAPNLPDPSIPNIPDWVKTIQSECTFDANTTVIAHSFGSVAALKVTESLQQPLKRLVLVGGFIDPDFADKEREHVFDWKFDFEKIITNAPDRRVLQCIPDHAASEKQSQALAKALEVEPVLTEVLESHGDDSNELGVFEHVLDSVRIFTTRPDTLYGATYMVLAPEHTLVQANKNKITNWDEVAAYIEEAANKKEMDRLDDTKEKTGVILEGITAVNPASGEEIPVYIADYVLASYGTGAIMAVPAHDERDYAFARKFKLPIKAVIAEQPVTHAGAVLEQRGKSGCYLFQLRSQDAPTNPGNYGMFGGGIDQGESWTDCLIRELNEELELEVAKQDFGDTYAFLNKAGKHCISTTFISDIDKKQLVLHEGDAIVEMSLEELLSKDNVSPKFFELVQKILDGTAYYTGTGYVFNSGEFDSMDSEAAKRAITEKVGGRMTSTYKIKDWVFSRQRYWGEPIPIIHCEKCGPVAVPEEQLPVTLPEVEHYEPAGDGQSPLATIEDWVNTTCPECGGAGKRETNTMPQWAGSSWYYLRYMDPKNSEALVDTEKEQYWGPVDVYSGGDHAVRHLIYVRFWHKFLYDIGVVSTTEPFPRLEFLGNILAEDGRKMSKRWGNTINPDDIVDLVGADTLRVYEMFMGPFENTIAWSQDGLAGARRFLERVYGLSEHVAETEPEAVTRQLHKTIKKVSEDIEAFKFNTAVSAMMIFLNEAEKAGLTKGTYLQFLRLLAPFAPHLTEELWTTQSQANSIHLAPWPPFDPLLAKDDTVTIGVQVNGKLRGNVTLAVEASQETALADALAVDTVQKYVVDEPKKIVYVPGRILNIIV